MARYHATVTKNITVRLPDDLAADAEALARVEGTSLNETVEESLAPTVAQRRIDPEIEARVARIIEKDRLGGLLRPLTGQA
jgi:predicted transcriptional regulator